MSLISPVVSVSQLNKQVKSFLENELGQVHVEGEISNLSKPASGHFYFTLKDSSAQIRCVFFKNRHFGPFAGQLSDGKKIVATGVLSLYEARGDYQLIVEQITDAGLGELYHRFEELKNKLAAEGLFNPARKKKIPEIPRTIGIITSSNGAALRDILSTLARRFPLANILIYPSEVQGATAPQQLIQALRHANKFPQCDVLILARGGGSIEDLWAFNNEQLAREIAISVIPVVSGVGHETDFTIADFVADLRAETPTAAAVAVTPNCLELCKRIDDSLARLQTAITRHLQHQQLKVSHLLDKISSPRQAIITYWQKIDYLERQLLSSQTQFMARMKQDIHRYEALLHAHNPRTQIEQTQLRINQNLAQLIQHIKNKVMGLRHQLKNNLSTFHAVSPLATLERGYAIATLNDKILSCAQQLHLGDTIEVRLAQGQIACKVTEIKDKRES
ncbi:exodeoxyribonuclease VII large subunit [Legionella worsleiensis]|uniref:Exodeoxyribonuclease 7 large subunit n=1 Tax=Legionella worsleiensis TaxID=45076 RepID=A0A0W1A3N0_9GAMM|nr:exodeoxyribonuclease VII large subunit [Legionella worsleiensis]KTD75951.1 exodeoxyribonuclease VII large subunit [Legionella worsleiensis]STY32964.1 exodeoxyribonuclease VII large subunit [Legionella worsleiensis]